MAVVFNEGVYPEVTAVIDAHGCLHLFEGSHIPTNHPTLPKVNGKEADVFMQSEDDISSIYECLDEHERWHLYKGYCIITKHIPDDYFTTT